MMVAVVPFREVHFYLVHRLIHWPPLCRTVHKLHHKYFECNDADGAIPLDKWSGSFQDGSDAAQEAMNVRFMARAAAKAARAAKRQDARA